MKKYFAISDPHSYYLQAKTAVVNAGFDASNPEHFIIICGDAFDRGDFSVELFAWMKQLQAENRLIYVRGNHEDLLEDCVFDIRKRRDIGRHHISNGTVNTIADFLDCSQYDILCNTFEWNQFDARMDELLNFINEHCVDYFQLGNTVFVHGWIPTTVDENGRECVHVNWRDGGWRDARWPNGMEMFHKKLVPPDITTIVCGHWHTSFAWHYYEDICPEWGNLAKFDAYVKYDETLRSRIVALDACTAYSKKVNCVIFDEDGIIIDNKYSL